VLSALPRLRVLNFRDVDYGISPVCRLANYELFCLHYLSPGLEKLDGRELVTESSTLDHEKEIDYGMTGLSPISKNNCSNVN